MFLRFCVASAILLLLFLGGCGARRDDRGESAPSGPIEGTFIQYEDWMMKLSRRDWQLELEAMSRAGMRTVVIVWLRWNESSFMPQEQSFVDPTATILDYAASHDMKVFVGLAYADFWFQCLDDPQYVSQVSRTSTAVANEAWKRYGRYPAFAGWYLSPELRDANYAPYHISLVRTFWRHVGDHCRAISGGKPVAIAPSMSGLVAPDTFQSTYTALLRGSGIDIVMFQDGVGARRWDADFETRIVPYFQAMQTACRQAAVTLWSDIEIFHKTGEPSRSVPASAERIRRQLAVESPFVEKFIMFDFFHYMSPRRGAAQKKLYEDYLRMAKTHAALPEK
jgi:hypothetical protein